MKNLLNHVISNEELPSHDKEEDLCVTMGDKYLVNAFIDVGIDLARSRLSLFFANDEINDGIFLGRTQLMLVKSLSFIIVLQGKRVDVLKKIVV